MSTTTLHECIGVDLPAQRGNSRTVAENLQLLQRVSSAKPAPEPNLPPMATPVPVFSGKDGSEVALLPTPSGPTLVPWVRGSQVDPTSDQSMVDGGFVSREQLATLQSDSASWSQPGPTKEQLLAAILAALSKASATKMQGTASSNTSGEAAPSSYGSDVSSSPSTASEEKTESEEPSIWDTVEDRLPNIAAETLVKGLADAWESGVLNASLLTAGIGGLLSGIGMTAATTALFRLMGKGPDANSSVGEWAISQVGPIVGKEVLTMGNFTKWLGQDPPGPYALRLGDVDKKCNKITAGLPSVLIENACAARVGDPVEKTGVAVQFGSSTVRIGGQPAARLGPADSMTMEGQMFGTSACRTEIGGLTTNPDPPVPDALKGLPQVRNPDASASMPNQRSAILETDGMGGHEWRGFDPQIGHAATESELAKLSDWGIFGDIFRADKNGPNWLGINQTKDNWYLLGGLIDLGSPEWPGAGNASFWFVPDRILWVDMRDFFSLHDWEFRPTDAGMGLGQVFSDAEIPALLANIRWDPLGLLLQAIYSTATSTYGVLQWLGSNPEAREANSAHYRPALPAVQ